MNIWDTSNPHDQGATPNSAGWGAYDYGNEANAYRIPTMAENNLNLGGAPGSLWSGGQDDKSASTEAIPPPPPPLGMPDVSGFASYGMMPPGLQNIPYAQTMGGELPPVPQPLGLLDASATAAIPELRNENRINITGLFGMGQPEKRKVDVQPSKLTAYLSSLGVSNG